MSDIVPRPTAHPAAADTAADTALSPGAGDLSFIGLALRVLTFTRAAHRLTEQLGELRDQMERDADEGERLAEQAGLAEVDPRFLSQMAESAAALRAVAEASGQTRHAADLMAMAAQDVNDSHEAEYRGVYEAVQASGAQQPKPGFLRTH
ncbi:hypothetical protein [Streptomyces sp. NRRL B-24484]|uniref:hypothetical protein n=1 Tax=Streptomyces sp. NRRL B-24484 TaxID=1463833 RepID=UPI0004C1139E|nr:hypothetical protein [Streptomyces sp. NRRL B-24484]